jgi:hypothetical protein
MIAKLIPVAILVACGCSVTAPEPDLSAILSQGTEGQGSEETERLEFDFGAVLARDQRLRHDFQIKNRSERALKITGSKANVPCCSGLGQLPQTIAPGGLAIIPAFIKVGQISEIKRVTFEILTDSPSISKIVLGLSARLVNEWNVEEGVGNRSPAKVGESTKKTYRVIGRRKAGEGLRAPSSIESTGDLKIDYVGSSTEVESSDGVIENSRDVTVILTPQSTSGEKSGSLNFRWPDGSTHSYPIKWTIKPSLQAFPSVLVFKPERALVVSEIEIRSEVLAFRVLKVSGDLLKDEVEPSAQALTVHKIRLSLDLSKVVSGEKPKVEIVTDHPEQQKLSVTVFVLPEPKGSNE